MVMSTRRAASLGTTRIRSFGSDFARVITVIDKQNTASRPRIRVVLRACMRCRSSQNHFLFGVVESNTLAGLNRSDVHAERDGMAVACFDISVGLLPAANAFHPIFDIADSRIIGSGVGRGARA